MNWGDLLPAIIVAIIAAIPGLVALHQNKKKTEAETEEIGAKTEKAKAEADSIHAQVADRWAEHVTELQKNVNVLEKQGECDRHEITGLRLDIQQVRRDNEQYRMELVERDAIIADMKDWTERLIAQFRKHIPDVEPESFIRRDRSKTQYGFRGNPMESE